MRQPGDGKRGIMPHSEPGRYDRLTDAEHDTMVEAVRAILRAGNAAVELADSFRWRELSLVQAQMKSVLLCVGHSGLNLDVLDMMEDNDG